MAKTYDYSKLPAEERWILDQTLQTGNLNYFTNFYFRLPNSGTMWCPDDCLGNYRNVFAYEQLHDAWANNGKPETFTITAGDEEMDVVQYFDDHYHNDWLAGLDKAFQEWKEASQPA